MRKIIDLIIATSELVEAETRNAKKQVFTLGLCLALTFVAGALLLISLVLCALPLYSFLSAEVSSAFASLLLGFLSFIAAWILFWIAKNQSR